jgi:NADPH:quinone reductase-like Zn-dependent oxidoreductase
MGDWEGGLTFPRIQGADAVGNIEAVGEGVTATRVGERVVCDPYIRDKNDVEGLASAGFLGSEYDGAFAQYVIVPTENAVSVPRDLPVSDAALATLPCSGGTAMNMLLLAGAKEGDTALVTGASGGVGTFLVQILKALGAEVIALAGKDKMSAVSDLGADHVIERGQPDLVKKVLEATEGRSLNLVADIVGGDQFPSYLKLLRRGGRYVTAGAIGGPLVTLDLRTLYLKNLSMFGSAVYRRDAFPHIVDLVIRKKVNPIVSKSWPLGEIHAAQTAFLEKKHVGSPVLLPPA